LLPFHRHLRPRVFVAAVDVAAAAAAAAAATVLAPALAADARLHLPKLGPYSDLVGTAAARFKPPPPQPATSGQPNTSTSSPQQAPLARSPDMCHIPPASKPASQPTSQSFSQQETRGRRLVVGGGSKRLEVPQQVAQLRPVKAKGYLQATRRAASGPNQKTHEAEEARCARGQRGPLSLALQLAPPAGGPLLLHTDPFSSAQLGPVSCPFIKQAHRRCAHTRRQPVRRRRGFHCNGGW